MNITSLKGEDLDIYLSEERNEAIQYLEQYYREEQHTDKLITKIRRHPCKSYILLKTVHDKVVIYGDMKEDILRLLIREGYKTLIPQKN